MKLNCNVTKMVSFRDKYNPSQLIQFYNATMQEPSQM